jgi:hypothetical protein
MKQDVKRIQAAALDAAVPGTWTTLSEEQLERFTREFSGRLIQEVLDVLEAYGVQYPNHMGLMVATKRIADHFQ